jgi:hypothetical protein
MEARLVNWIKAVRSLNAACAWFVRKERYGPVYSDGVRPNCFFPGVAIVIQPAPAADDKTNGAPDFPETYR